MTRGAEPIRAVLLDIEGTTTPMAFVTEVLFPFARRHVRQHLTQHAASPEYAALIDRLRDDHDASSHAGEPVPPWSAATRATRVDSAAAYVEWLIDRDRKSTPLKELQGRIWEDGYARGELIGQVFADVPRAFAVWHAAGTDVGIFSSGSVLAQRLLFRHSTAGDLGRFILWHFDTTTGAKADVASYTRIASAMAVQPTEILFISDIPRELDAARTAGLHTLLCTRPGNATPPDGHGHEIIRSFDEVFAG